MDVKIVFAPEVTEWLDMNRKPFQEYGPIEINLFRDLTPEQEFEFRMWARDNMTADDEEDPLHHPVIRDELRRIKAGLPVGDPFARD